MRSITVKISRPDKITIKDLAHILLELGINSKIESVPEVKRKVKVCRCRMGKVWIDIPTVYKFCPYCKGKLISVSKTNKKEDARCK